MADARKDKRTLLSLKIRYKSATLEDFIERYSSDISQGGVFIKAKKPLAVGTLLKFEFMLQDESTLIHGVGRVVWRREQTDAGPEEPAGMGIKFIKMDADSRAVVQRIADDRGRPGVYDQGKEGSGRPQVSDSEEPNGDDQTKVRHVNEFLTSALEHGEQGHPAAAHGAFAAHGAPGSPKRQSASEAQARGAMSAFGGAGGSAAARISSAAAPTYDEIDPEDDFLDDEATKVHEYAAESYRPEAAATVITEDAASLLDPEMRRTPKARADETTGQSVDGGVQDLFGAGGVDSFGPAPGEVIDTDFFDSEDRKLGQPVPDTSGIPSEAFKVPQSPEPVWTMSPKPKKQARPGLVVLLIATLVVAGASVAAWQLGLVDGLIDTLAQSSSPSAEPSRSEVPVAAPAVNAPEGAATDSTPTEEAADTAAPAKQDETQETASAGPEADAVAPTAAADAGIVKFEVTSEPRGAFVTVDRKRMGRTPIVIEHEVGTKLSIYAKARGYLGQRQQIEVTAGQGPVTLQLVPLPYVVQIETEPPGAMASAAGAGVVVTPGEMRFKSMPRSRKIVLSMNGYETVNKFVTRASFTEETRQMFATVKPTLRKEGAGSSAKAKPAAPSAAEAEPTAAPDEEASKPGAAPAPSEVKAESPAAAAPVEEPSAPSETEADDAP